MLLFTTQLTNPGLMTVCSFRFAVEIQPTGTVSEYTATIADEMVREGKRGRHKVETLKLILKAEGNAIKYDVWTCLYASSVHKTEKVKPSCSPSSPSSPSIMNKYELFSQNRGCCVYFGSYLSSSYFISGQGQLSRSGRP